MRPLSGDYAFNFANVAPLYAGDPSRRRPGARLRARPRATRASTARSPPLSRRNRRRAAPRPNRRQPPRSSPGPTPSRHRHRSAGRGIRRSAVHRPESHHVHSARATRRRDLGTPVVPMFWVDAEDHDWDEIASCTILDAQHQPRTITLPQPEGAGERPIAALTLDDSVNDALDELEGALAPTEFTGWLLEGAARDLPAGRRRGRRLRAMAGSCCSARSASWCSTRRIQRSNRCCGTLSSRSRDALDRRRRWPRRPAKPFPRAAMHRKSFRRPTACRSSGSTARASRSGSGRRLRRRGSDVHGEGARRGGFVGAAALQPERAAAPAGAGHAVSDHLLRGRPERARLPGPAGRGLPALRPAHAAHSSPRHRHPGRLRHRPLPQKYDVPFEDLQPQDEARAEPAAPGAAAADRGRVA